MEYVFLFWVFLVGVVIATLQDLKRREVDNWLNFFMLIVGVTFILFEVVFGSGGVHLLLRAGFVLLVGFVLMNVFYYGHVFAGGDAKLLFALSILFVGKSFFESGLNFFVFVMFLMFSGAVYGTFYSLVLYFMHFKKSNKEIKKHLIEIKFWFFILLGLVLMIFYFLHNLFAVFAVLIALFPFLFSFAKGLEDVVMIREVKGKDLREGDWLASDVKFRGKTIKSSFEGVNSEEIEFLKKKGKVKIKDGIPFVPAFLIGYILYYFYADYALGLLLLLF